MRTSLTKLQKNEAYLFGTMSVEERIIVEANLLINDELSTDLHLQAKAYRLIKLSGRKALRAEIEKVAAKISRDENHAPFWKSILTIFK